MELELLLMNVLIMTGFVFFGHFEEKTARWRRVLKWVVYMTVALLLIPSVGRPWSFLVIVFPALLGVSVHLWWCRKHSIHPLTAEPRDKYYALRGWRQA